MSNSMNFLPGDIVLAKAGKESGKYLVILKSDSEYAYLSDGKRCKVQNPKKKKFKHVTAALYSDDYIREKSGCGEVTNKEVKRAISNYLKRIDNN